ncbi:MAG: cytochrome P450 [Pseudomonadota bacterium]
MLEPTTADPAPDRPPRAPQGFRPAHAPPVTRPMSLPQVAATVRRNVLETIPALAYRQPMVSGRTVIRWHMVADPAALRRVLLENVDNYPKSKVTERLLRPAVGVSIFTSRGDEWRWQRRAAAPIFNHRNLTAMAPLMSAAADRAAGRLEAAVDRGFGGVGTACVMAEMVGATFDIVADTLLSGDPALDQKEIGAAIDRYIDTIGRVSLLDIVQAPNWIPRPAQLLNRRLLDGAGATVDGLIAKRRAELEAGGRRDDLLGYLLTAADPETGRRMDDATLRNNLLSFIVAGHETTALALAWSLYLLANAPEIQERAAEEARAAIGAGPAEAGHLDRLGYVGQIVDEAMRLYPPAAMLSRQALEADALCGREIRPGDTVILPIYTLHRHELWWVGPLEFDPENFAPARARGRDRFLYLPFGAGPRICIGMSFALMEAKIILATLLARLRFAPRPGAAEPAPVMTMTLRPKGGMPLKVARR